MEGVCRDVSVQHDITVDFTHEGIPSNVAPATALCLYRILQEALHNVAKHSGASRAEVRLMRERNSIFMRIDDMGAGFDPEAVDSTGLGLVSMRERVNHVGGRLTIGSAPGAGARIGVHLPLVPAIEPGADFARAAESA
jgi:signal transduction histidine kinase